MERAGDSHADDVTYRNGREEDALPAAVVFKRALDALYRGFNLPEVEGPESSLVPYHRHLLRTDGSRFWVAEAADRVIGYGAGIVRGEWWYLSALFVLPEFQGRGVGRELLRRARADRALTDGDAATITDALQPVSNTLYARHGLLPWLPILGLAGTPPPVTRPLPASYDAIRIDASLLAEVRRIDESVTGLDRSVDHAYLLSAGGGRLGWLLCRGARPEGYVYITPGGLIGPSASLDQDGMALLMRFALGSLEERGAERVSAAVPGPNVEAQRVLLQAGLVYENCPGLLLASRPFGRFDRYVIASYGLM